MRWAQGAIVEMSTTTNCCFLLNPRDDCVTVASVNYQGLGNRQKRKDVFHYLRNKKYSIYFLQDTHFEPKIEIFISAEWGYESYFSSYSSNSRGVAILFNNNFEFKVKDIHKGDRGNCIILTIRIKKIIFCWSVYMDPIGMNLNFITH